jgi:hypothetical protein
MRLSKLAALAVGVAAVVGAAAPAYAVTFADFSATDSFNNIQWDQSAAMTGGTLHAVGAGVNTANVKFSFLTPSLIALSNLPATLTYVGTVADGTPALNFGYLVQNGLGGNFNFTYSGPSTTIGAVTLNTGANLLSGTFGGGNIAGPVNSSAGTVNDATTSGGVISFASDFLTFQAGDQSYSFSLTSIVDPLNASTGQSLDSFGAVATGSFEAALSGGGGQGGVPEPATWAMLIVGFAGVGFAVRRKARQDALVLG